MSFGYCDDQSIANSRMQSSMMTSYQACLFCPDLGQLADNPISRDLQVITVDLFVILF